MDSRPLTQLSERWSESFVIRRRDAFEIHGARRAVDQKACTVVIPGEEASQPEAEIALKALAEAHRSIQHTHCARTLDVGWAGGLFFVELDCPAVADAIEAIRLMPTMPRKLPYAAGDAFIFRLREALDTAHEVTDPVTGRPLCLGCFSAGNVLFDAKGHWYLIGLGHNVAVLQETGAVDGSVAFFSPHEVSAGMGTPTPESDYVALIAFARSLISYINVAEAIGQVLLGVVTESSRELAELLRWVEQRVLGELPARRPSVPEAVKVAHRIRKLANVTIDPAGFAAYIVELLQLGGLPPVPHADAAPLALAVGADIAWVMAGDGIRQRVSGAQRRILRELIRRELASDTSAMSVWELFQAGWPGERATTESSLNRVYVTLTRLRERGLRDAIERIDDGWRLAPNVVVNEQG